MGDFSDRVFEQVRRIPQGKVSTYGQIARLIGSPRSARYVGWALRGNTQPVKTPVQRELLEKEGVRFIDAHHVDMGASLWNPELDDINRPANIDWEREMGND